MSTFNRYAEFYDRLYEDKDYLNECKFIESIIEKYSIVPAKKLLDLGCGTGGHSIPLAKRGYRLTGIDISEEMLKIAEKKSNGIGVDVELINTDIRKVDLKRKFDAVLAMFAVMSYQTTNDDLIAAFGTARTHLEQDGLFIFDSWFGPSVLAIQPTEREKIIEDGDQRIVRVAKPSLDINKHAVEVTYTVRKYKREEVLEEVHESHKLRFLFTPEVQLLCKITDFELIHHCPFMDLNRQPTEQDWNVTWIARAV